MAASENTYDLGSQMEPIPTAEQRLATLQAYVYGVEAERDRLKVELNTCRVALDKTALERDGYHSELMQAQAQTLRVAADLQTANRIIDAVRAVDSCHCPRSEDGCEHIQNLLALLHSETATQNPGGTP